MPSTLWPQRFGAPGSGHNMFMPSIPEPEQPAAPSQNGELSSLLKRKLHTLHAHGFLAAADQVLACCLPPALAVQGFSGSTASAPSAVNGSAEALMLAGHSMLKDARDSDLMPSLGQDVVPSASGAPFCKRLSCVQGLLLLLGCRSRQGP